MSFADESAGGPVSIRPMGAPASGGSASATSHAPAPPKRRRRKKKAPADPAKARLENEEPFPREVRGIEWTPALRAKIVQLIRNGVPMEIAFGATGVSRAAYKHARRTASQAVTELGFDLAVQSRYAPLVLLFEEIQRAKDEGTAAVCLLWRQAANKNPRVAETMLSYMAPEHFARRRRDDDEDDDDREHVAALPAAAVIDPALGGESPIKLFLPEEIPVSSTTGAPPESSRVTTIGSRPAIVESSDDFEGEVITVEGRAVG